MLKNRYRTVVKKACFICAALAVFAFGGALPVSAETSDSRAASRIIDQLYNFKAGIYLFSVEREYVTPYEAMPELEARFEELGSVGKFIEEYAVDLDDDNLAEYFFETKETRDGKVWLIGRDLLKESDGVKLALREAMRRNYRQYNAGICDENLRPYNGGNAVYMVITF